jgi:hypothetical protein
MKNRETENKLVVVRNIIERDFSHADMYSWL